MCGMGCHYYPPDTCIGHRAYNYGLRIYESYSQIYKCSEDGSFVTQLNYNTSYKCEGNIQSSYIFNNTQMTPFNCNGIDCSSIVRVYYSTCNIHGLNAVFNDNVQLTSICEYNTFPGQATIVTCNDTSQTQYVFQNDYNGVCNFSATYDINVYSQGCHYDTTRQTDTYYDVLQCNMP